MKYNYLSLLSSCLVLTTHPVFAWTAGFTSPVAGTVCTAGKTCPLTWFILNGTDGAALANTTDATNGTLPAEPSSGTTAPNITDIYLFSGLNTSLVRGAKITPNGVDPQTGTFDWMIPTTVKDGLDYTVGMEDTIDKTYHYSHYFTIQGAIVTTTSTPVQTSTKPTVVPTATLSPVQNTSSAASLNDLSILALFPLSLFAAIHV